MILNNPIISNESEENEILTFTINNINISLAKCFTMSYFIKYSLYCY